MGIWRTEKNLVQIRCAKPYRYLSGPENLASFDTIVVVVGDGANMVLNEKLTNNWKLRGLKLRGLT